MNQEMNHPQKEVREDIKLKHLIYFLLNLKWKIQDILELTNMEIDIMFIQMVNTNMKTMMTVMFQNIHTHMTTNMINM